MALWSSTVKDTIISDAEWQNLATRNETSIISSLLAEIFPLTLIFTLQLQQKNGKGFTRRKRPLRALEQTRTYDMGLSVEFRTEGLCFTHTHTPPQGCGD